MPFTRGRRIVGQEIGDRKDPSRQWHHHMAAGARAFPGIRPTNAQRTPRGAAGVSRIVLSPALLAVGGPVGVDGFGRRKRAWC
ncbi:hypothetical protein HYQ46_007973 [Verticillium longisporum]|nr:hypothetical protein HYQ46_007973 [Verticillium longisporum]